jgi:hypothetical protein
MWQAGWVVMRLLATLGVLVLGLPDGPDAVLSREHQAAVGGLDHIPIAVSDLEGAAARYRSLGFALKPGRPHDNGIRNQHVKFTDGTELELITAPEARDPLTRTYRQHLADGDGPAFLALYTPVRDRVPKEPPPPGYIFFGPRNASPTDRPEHFAHPNTAASLIAVWLAGDDLTPERRLLEAVGARFVRREVNVPDPFMADVAQVGSETIVFLPGSRQLVPGRRIIGATVRVRSLATAQRVVGTGGPATQPSVVRHASSIFLPPALTHGLWLELREGR